MTRRLAALLAFAAVLATAFAIDHPVARYMAGVDSRLVQMFRVITWFGQGGVVLYPTGIILIVTLALKQYRHDLAKRLDRVIARATLIFVTVAAAGLVNDALKIIFGRARPGLWLGAGIDGFQFWRFQARFASFPSGHTATSVAAAIAFCTLFPQGRIAFAAAAILIAASRVIINAHYLSDVIAGAAVGAAVTTTLLGRVLRSARFRRLIAQGQEPNAVESAI